MERKTEEDILVRPRKMEVGGNRKTGRPKLRWTEDVNEKGAKIQ